MHKPRLLLFVMPLVFITSLFAAPVSTPPYLEFQQLPKEIRDHAVDVRGACKKAKPDMTFTDMQGIVVLDLNGDGSRDIIVDDEGLCSGRLAGENCSSRSCDVLIYKEEPRGQWRKIFDEHLYDKHLAIDWETMRLQLMVASIYAGDPRCQPKPKREYALGRSCNLIVTYRKSRWIWQLIR
jgi:hypothetical protein